jgi:hypothetical protein
MQRPNACFSQSRDALVSAGPNEPSAWGRFVVLATARVFGGLIAVAVDVQVGVDDPSSSKTADREERREESGQQRLSREGLRRRQHPGADPWPEEEEVGVEPDEAREITRDERRNRRRCFSRLRLRKRGRKEWERQGETNWPRNRGPACPGGVLLSLQSRLSPWWVGHPGGSPLLGC